MRGSLRLFSRFTSCGSP
jgi:hypothetical protein